MGEHETLWNEGERLAEALDDYRDQLVTVDLPDDLLALWIDASTHVWDALEATGEHFNESAPK